MKKILILFSLFVLVSCGTNKKVVNTNKKTTTSRTVATRTTTSKPTVSTTRTTTNPTRVETTKPKTDNKPTQPQTTEELEATSRVKITTQGVIDYINTYKESAKQNMIDYKIPASITIAQGILESGAGTGTLSRKANNHFGIKCHKEWEGESVFHDDDAKDECFRKYTNAAESWRDHAIFLSTRKYYVALFDLPIDDYKAWAHGLKKAGYATDPKYPTKLISLIERYELNQYDAEVLGKEFVSNKVSDIKENTNSVTQIHQGRIHKVQKGDTLFAISRTYNTTVDELKRINQMTDNSLNIGQIIKLP